MKNDELELLFKNYYHILFIYALSLTKNQADAQDLVSETFLKAYLSYDDTKGNFKTWIYKVCKNLFIDSIRKKKRLLNENQFEIQWVEDPYMALSAYMKEEKKRWLYAAIYQLSSKERDVMLLSLLWDMKDQEIARHLHISEENVRTLRYRCKKKLKEKALKEGLFDE